MVVYDRLAGTGVLALIPEGAEKIDVGKESSYHKVPQEAIHQILIDKAREGRRVVRLKGGDPFVFGRGGEELERLEEQGIAYDVIPGITSAVAAAAYAGIPVTHREYASSLHIVTGHAKAGRETAIDFDALVRIGGTLVFLMGVAALPSLVMGLLAAGMSPDTPAAVVENGTLPAQRRCLATLDHLVEQAAAMAIGSPAVIVVGKVCALAERFGWYDRLPLKGCRVLVTRPKNRIGALSEKFRRFGADVTECPCIKTVPFIPCPPMEQKLKEISRYEWITFTSAAGVDACWSCLTALGHDARWFAEVKLAAIGNGTATALATHGLTADLIPEVFDAAHLGAALAAQAHGRVLILRAEEGSSALTAALSENGVAWDDIAVYRTELVRPPLENLRYAVEQGAWEFVTFTSASTVKGFAAALGDGADVSHITGLCIGEQTAAEARRYGLSVRIAKQATLDDLVQLAMETI